MRKYSGMLKFFLLIPVVLIPAVSAAGPPDWSVNPPDYQHTGSVTSAVYRNLVDVGSEGDMLAAFAGDQCRGVVGALETPGSNFVFPLMVYSNQAAGESLSFWHYDSELDVTCHIQERVEFEADMIIGRSWSPMGMHVDGCQPFPPSNPAPCDLCWQDPVEVLSWESGDLDAGDSVVYYVYLGTEADPPIYDTTEVYDGSTAVITYTITPMLMTQGTFHWKIVAEDRQGMTTTGPVWSFDNTPDATEPTPWGRIKMLFR
jgi:hypothetical protein